MTSHFSYWLPKRAAKVASKFPGDFTPVRKSPFDRLHTLNLRSKVSRHELARAAFETGYGPKKDWPSTLLMGGPERTALSAFLSARVEWVLSMFDISNGQIRPQNFSRYVESSEWSTVSYYMGQIAARIAADR